MMKFKQMEDSIADAISHLHWRNCLWQRIMLADRNHVGDDAYGSVWIPIFVEVNTWRNLDDIVRAGIYSNRLVIGNLPRYSEFYGI